MRKFWSFTGYLSRPRLFGLMLVFGLASIAAVALFAPSASQPAASYSAPHTYGPAANYIHGAAAVQGAFSFDQPGSLNLPAGSPAGNSLNPQPASQTPRSSSSNVYVPPAPSPSPSPSPLPTPAPPVEEPPLYPVDPTPCKQPAHVCPMAASVGCDTCGCGGSGPPTDMMCVEQSPVN